MTGVDECLGLYSMLKFGYYKELAENNQICDLVVEDTHHTFNTRTGIKKVLRISDEKNEHTRTCNSFLGYSIKDL